MNTPTFRQPPTMYWAYLAGTALLVTLSFLPSGVKTSYTWKGTLLEILLLGGLFLGSNICRWVLLLIGFLGAAGGVLIQHTPLEPVAMGWSVIALFVTLLLLSSSMRRHTQGRLRRYWRLRSGVSA